MMEKHSVKLLDLHESEILWKKYHMEMLHDIIHCNGDRLTPCLCGLWSLKTVENTVCSEEEYMKKITELGNVTVSLFTMEHVSHAYINACREYPQKSSCIQDHLILLLNTYLPRGSRPEIEDIDVARRILHDLKSVYAVKSRTISTVEACMR